jgi:hypothetical protein
LNKQALSQPSEPPSTLLPATIEGPLGLPRQAPLAKAGRPSVLTDAVKEQLCLLLSVGLSRRQAASYLNIAPATISQAARRDADLAHSLLRAEDLAAVHPHITLIAESKKNWRAAAWLLERRQRYPAPLSDEEKAERDAERLADERRQVALRRKLRQVHEEDRQEEARRRMREELAQRGGRLKEESGR